MVLWPAAKLKALTGHPRTAEARTFLPLLPPVQLPPPAVLAPAPRSCPAASAVLPAAPHMVGLSLSPQQSAAFLLNLLLDLRNLLLQHSNLLLQRRDVLCCCLRHAVSACMEGAQGHGVGGNIGQVCYACSTRLRGLERKKSSHHHERSPFCTRHSLAQPNVFCGTLQKALVAAGQTEREEEKGKGGLRRALAALIDWKLCDCKLCLFLIVLDVWLQMGTPKSPRAPPQSPRTPEPRQIREPDSPMFWLLWHAARP